MFIKRIKSNTISISSSIFSKFSFYYYWSVNNKNYKQIKKWIFKIIFFIKIMFYIKILNLIYNLKYEKL